MPGIEFDPEILQEFLTESTELLDSLESDLVELEEQCTDMELINKAFRALHTIKGSASFLAMAELVSIAHAAETALNAARNGDTVIDGPLMDMLLRAIDVIKVQLGEIESGSETLTAPDPALVAGLIAIGEGKPPSDSDVIAEPADSAQNGGPGNGNRKLELEGAKADLLGMFVEDLDSQLSKLSEQIETLLDEENRGSVAAELEEIGSDLHATIDFFEFDSMGTLTGAVIEAAAAAALAESVELDQAVPRMRALLSLVNVQRDGLAKGELIDPEHGELISHLLSVVEEGNAPDAWRLPAGADENAVFRIDNAGGAESSVPPIIAEPADSDAPPPDPMVNEPADSAAPPPDPTIAEPADAAAAPSANEPKKAKKRAALVEKTLRVEVSRLESLMNLVGELVLQKNRICELSRSVGLESGVPDEIVEPLELAGAGLDRLTSEIQVAVMRTRMQPLDKLFGKYPRLIRDLSKKTGKQMHLEILGGETEVDKQVIEELGDPLIHLLRNSADHGIEMPDDRVAAGKPAEGTITLRAAHQGNHAVISISDDGKGLHRSVIGGKAVEKGLVTEAELANLSDNEVFRFIFAAGFSTAGSVSDLSGRGVGMDVVSTNIERTKGTIDVTSTPGQGTTLSILIPLTVAILPAMMVKISGEIYAIPLSHILEIVRPDDAELSTILESRVVRLRGSVFPLIDASERFDSPELEGSEPHRLTVVLEADDRTIGLLVEEVIGQQEIVIKPLDGLDQTGPFSGATVRNDGGVSLIIDVAEMVREAQ